MARGLQLDDFNVPPNPNHSIIVSVIRRFYDECFKHVPTSQCEPFTLPSEADIPTSPAAGPCIQLVFLTGPEY